MRTARHRPGDFEGRRRRAEALTRSAATAANSEAAAGTSVAAAPLGVLHAVLAWQAERATSATVAATAALLVADADGRRQAGRYPLLDLSAAVGQLAEEIPRAVEAIHGIVPPALAEAGEALVELDAATREELSAAWLDDVSLVEARLAFWVQTAAAPLLEPAAAVVDPPERHQWTGAACPLCGGQPQASVIAEESGEFMAGSPRSLVCARCAGSWIFPRARCVACGEEDTTRLHAVSAELWPAARIDSCDTCHAYIKTFDLRRPGGVDVVPQVDDVATVTLDVWAGEHGLSRPVRSLAGV